MQILKKFIGNDQVADEKIRLDNDQYLRGRNAANSADISILKISATNEVEFGAILNAGGFELKNLGAPTAGSSAATKTYVDTEIAAAGAGALYARVVAVANVTVSNPGTAVFDGVTLSNGELILLTAQTAPAENGLYVFNGSGSALTRSTSLDASAEFTIGKLVVILEGTVNADSMWALQAAVATVGTSAVDFDQVSGGGGGGGANTSLSNLASVAINEDLLPDGDAQYSIGAVGLAWVDGFFGNEVESGSFYGAADGSASLRTRGLAGLTANTTITTGDSSGDNSGITLITTGTSNAATGLSGATQIKTGNGIGTNAGSGEIVIQTGDATGSGNAGNITIQTGAPAGAAGSGGIFLVTGSTPSGGTPGNIQLAPGSNGTDLGDIDLVAKNVEINGSSNGGEFSVTSFATTNFNALPLSNVADPGSAQDAATKAYVDAQVGAVWAKETITLSGTDITNQYIDLANVAKNSSIQFLVRGGGVQMEGASYEYSVSYTGGAGGNTRISFLNGIATAGASALVASDIIEIHYMVA